MRDFGFIEMFDTSRSLARVLSSFYCVFWSDLYCMGRAIVVDAGLKDLRLKGTIFPMKTSNRDCKKKPKCGVFERERRQLIVAASLFRDYSTLIDHRDMGDRHESSKWGRRMEQTCHRPISFGISDLRACLCDWFIFHIHVNSSTLKEIGVPTKGTSIFSNGQEMARLSSGDFDLFFVTNS